MNTISRDRNQEVLSALDKIHNIVGAIRVVKEKAKSATFNNRLYFSFVRFYLSWCFGKEKYNLLLLLGSSTHEISQSALFQAGEFFYKIGEDRHALRCFKCIANDRVCEDKDVCLMALMRRLEIQVGFLLKLVPYGLGDMDEGEELVELFNLINRDIHFISTDAQKILMLRLDDEKVKIAHIMKCLREEEVKEARDELS